MPSIEVETKGFVEHTKQVILSQESMNYSLSLE